MEVSYLSALLAWPEFCERELKDRQTSACHRIACDPQGESLLEFNPTFRGWFSNDSL